MRITQAWQAQAPWLATLAPLAWLYGWASERRQRQYQSGKKSVYRAPVPVWIVGNIGVGGAGKTPFIVALLRYLYKKNLKVGVVSRGYGGSTKTPLLVNKNSDPRQVGDEPCLLAQTLSDRAAEYGLPFAMAVCARRAQAVELLLRAYPDTQLIVADDGLSHYALARDAEWIVVDAARGFGNQKLLPQGFLREPLSRLQDVPVVWHYPKADRVPADALAMHLDLLALTPLLPSDKAPPKACAVYGLTGIGYPARFFAALRDLGFVVREKPLPDHHAFSLDDVRPLQDLPVIVTSKDAVKLRRLLCDASAADRRLFEKVWELPTRTVLSEATYQAIDRQLKEWGL